MGRLVYKTSDIFETASKRDYFEHIVVAKPSNFSVDYQINPYMDKEVNIDSDGALDQWERMVECMEEEYTVQTIDLHELYKKYELSHKPEEIPDFVFTANHWVPLGIEKESGVLLSNFANDERQPEIEYVKKFLEQQDMGYTTTKYDFEGQGDFLWQNDYNILWTGYGVRTEWGAVEFAEEKVGDDTLLVPLELQTDDHYHLDTCFRPLSTDTALAVREAFTEASYRRITDAFPNVIDVPLRDFSCNSVVMRDSRIVLSKESSVWRELNEYGFDTIRIGYDEFMKGGGSVACTVCPINL